MLPFHDSLTIMMLSGISFIFKDYFLMISWLLNLCCWLLLKHGHEVSGNNIFLVLRGRHMQQLALLVKIMQIFSLCFCVFVRLVTTHFLSMDTMLILSEKFLLRWQRGFPVTCWLTYWIFWTLLPSVVFAMWVYVKPFSTLFGGVKFPINAFKDIGQCIFLLLLYIFNMEFFGWQSSNSLRTKWEYSRTGFFL